MASLPATLLGTVQKLMGMKISIVSPETELSAREYLANIRKELKAFKASVIEVKKPFKKEIDEIDAAAKPWIEKLTQKDQETEQAILAYVKKVREETEKRNQKELEKFEKKVEKAEQKAVEQGKPMPLILPPSMAQAPAKSVTLDGAKQTIVKHKKWRIPGNRFQQDPSLLNASVAREIGLPIPLQYFTLDTAMIGKIVRAGGSIPGIEVYEEESLAQRSI